MAVIVGGRWVSYSSWRRQADILFVHERYRHELEVAWKMKTVGSETTAGKKDASDASTPNTIPKPPQLVKAALEALAEKNAPAANVEGDEDGKRRHMQRQEGATSGKSGKSGRGSTVARPKKTRSNGRKLLSAEAQRAAEERKTVAKCVASAMEVKVEYASVNSSSEALRDRIQIDDSWSHFKDPNTTFYR